MLGKKVKVTIDRPLGSCHPKYKDLYYPINYGYVEGIIAPDGEEQDAYILGVEKPLTEFEGVVIAIIHRNNDIEEKWVVAPEGSIFTKEEIETAVRFQEQYFDSEIIMSEIKFYNSLPDKMKTIKHPIPPIFDENSEILILGSFPSVKSREAEFFYGHPQNRFWKVMAQLFDTDIPITDDEKKALLLNNNVALWDVISECEIEGSSDSSIKNANPNDLNKILEKAKVKRIFTNGKTADKLYKKYLEKQTGIEAVCLPSTSPANAAWSLERLAEKWRNEIM